MKKYVAIAYIVAFLLLFISPAGAYELWGDHFDQTNFEKREPAEKPVFSVSTIREYPKAYEAYFNDSLPFRNQMITANGLINLWLFNQSPVRQVIIGKDGWLFYNNSEWKFHDDPIADYDGSSAFTEEELAAMASNLVAARDTLKAQGKAFVVMIAPNKACVYGNEFLPKKYRNGNTYTRADQVYDYLSAHTDLAVVHPKEQLFSAMQKDPNRIYYYKTDSHWNNLGGYVGTKALLEQLEIQVPPITEFDISVAEMYTGDLAEALGLKKYMGYDNEYVLNDYYEDRTVEDTTILEGSTKLYCYTTADADERSLFVVRDSYCDAMIPYLSKQFNTCSFVHIDQFTPDLLQKYPSDIVVVEVIERFVWKLQNFKAE